MKTMKTKQVRHTPTLRVDARPQRSVTRRASSAVAAQPVRPGNGLDRLRARLLELLERPNAAFFGDSPTCECRECVTRRQAAFRCKFCGYVGKPVVSPCECRDARARNLEFSRTRIAAIKAGRPIDDYSLERLEQMLVEDQRRPDRRCRHGSSRCLHGTSWCPTCGDSGDGRRDGEHLAALVKELRKVVVGDGVHDTNPPASGRCA